MKESEWQGYVVDVFTRHGWKVLHVPTPMRPVPGGKFVPDRRGRGLLDLLCIHEDPPRVVFIENKNEDGDLSVEQREVLRLLLRVADAAREHALLAAAINAVPTVRAYVFRPGSEALVEAVARGATVDT